MTAIQAAAAGTRPGPLEAWVMRVAAGERLPMLVSMVLLALFYLLTATHNLSETDDVFAFAWRAEHLPYDMINDPRLMLYHMGMRGLFLASKAIGLDVPALWLMRGVSALCAGAALVLLPRVIIRDLGLSPAAALASVIALATCYGFWRYAAEAEIYLPTILFCLLIFHGLSRAAQNDASMTTFAAWGAVGGIAVLCYQPNVVPLFLVFPLLLVRRGCIPNLLAYGIPGGIVIVVGLLIGFALFWPEPLSPRSFVQFSTQRASEFVVPPLTPRAIGVSLIRGVMALSHDIAGGNWVFGFEPVVKLVAQAYPNTIREEVYVARAAGWLVYLPLITLPAFVYLLWRAFRTAWPLSWRLLRERHMLVILIWFLIEAAIITRLNPAGLEAWIVVLPPLVLLFAVLVLEPCIRQARSRLVYALAGTLALQSAIGGMAVVWSPDGDYERTKSKWLLSEATEQDLVLIAGNANLEEFLRYESPAKIGLVPGHQAKIVADGLLARDLSIIWVRTYGRDYTKDRVTELIAETIRNGGRLFLFDEFFNRTWNLFAPRKPGESQHELKAVSKVVYSSELGSTYQVPLEGIDPAGAARAVRSPAEVHEQEWREKLRRQRQKEE